MQKIAFKIHRKPYMAWSADGALTRQNNEYVDSMDPDFFAYQADLHAAALHGKSGHYAALSIRLLYYHCLEVFFAHLMAALQAPDYVLGWLMHYRIPELRDCVSAINNGDGLFNKSCLKNPSWNDVAALVLHAELSALNAADVETFARLWRRCADVFLSEFAPFEHNSLKHGLRNRPGAFEIRIGGERPIEISGGEFGSSYYVPHPLGSGNFAPVRAGNHWNPHRDVGTIKLLVSSLANIRAFLTPINRTGQQSLRYEIPKQEWLKEFDNLDEPTLVSITFNTVPDIDDSQLPTRPQMNAFLDRAFPH